MLPRSEAKPAGSRRRPARGYGRLSVDSWHYCRCLPIERSTSTIRRVRKHLPKWVFIAVAERQERGAWHWHLAVVGRQDVKLLRHLWRSVVGEGNIDVQQPSAGMNRRLAIVKYLGKYLSKGFAEGDREINGHRFRASLGIKVPGKSLSVPEEFRGDVSGYVRAQLQQRAGKVGFVWDESKNMAGWACSW